MIGYVWSLQDHDNDGLVPGRVSHQGSADLLHPLHVVEPPEAKIPRAIHHTHREGVQGQERARILQHARFEEWQRSALNWHTCRVKYYKCGDGCTEEVGHAWKSFVSTQNQSLYLGRCVVGRREAMERDRRNQRHPTQETGSHPSIFIHKKERITLLLAQD